MAKNSTNTILIIFDIDETLVQYINCNNYFNWTRIASDPDQAIFLTVMDADTESYDKLKAGNGRKPTGDDASDSSNIPYLDSREKNGTKTCVLFRPNLDKFFNYVRKNNNKKEEAVGPRKIFIDIALWTAGSSEYAKMISSYLEARYGLDANYFVFIYSDYGSDEPGENDQPTHEGIKSDGPGLKRKDLNQIWGDDSLYNKFNTIIVDDDVDNLKHESNKNNGILVNKFMPFGGCKERIPLTKENYTKSNDDTMFADLTKIVTHLVKDRGGCSEEDVKHGYAKNESIFKAFTHERVVKNEISNPFNEPVSEEGSEPVSEEGSEIQIIHSINESNANFVITPNSYAILFPRTLTEAEVTEAAEAEAAIEKIAALAAKASARLSLSDAAEAAAAEAPTEGAAAEGGGYRYSLKKKKGRRGTRSRGTRKINKKRKGSKRNKK